MGAAPNIKNTIKFTIEIIKGPHAGTKFDFSKPSITIGRGPENDVVLSNDPRVSRQHAEIKRRGPDGFVLVNLSSKNFILVDGQNVQTEVITSRSNIQIGESEIRFTEELPEVTPEMPVAAPVVTPPLNFPQAPKTAVLTQQQPVKVPPKPQYQAPVQNGFSNANFESHSRPQQNSAAPVRRVQGSKLPFYLILAVLVLGAWFVMSPSKKSKKDPNAIRTSTISMRDAAEAEKRTQELLAVKKEKYDSVQYRRAQENFVKGFRDLQQGQYARARDSFQVVLNLDPENELAKRYYHLSKIKFDELVKFNMMQGNRYREKKNWRMCQSNYSNVMTMLQYRKNDPSYKEAKQFFDECTLNLEGRF